MSWEEPIRDESEEVHLMPKADDYVERFIHEETVGASEEHYLVDFQTSDARIRFDDEGNQVGMSGPLESSVRVYLEPTTAIDLAVDIANAVEDTEDIDLEKLRLENQDSETAIDEEDEGGNEDA